MDPVLKDFVKQFGPLALAVVHLKDKVTILDSLELEISEAGQRLDAAKTQLADAQRLADEAKGYVTTAKSEVIQAQAQRDQILAVARQESKRLVTAAMVEAKAQAEGVVDGLVKKRQSLEADIATTQNELESLGLAVATARKEHDEVLASIEVLSKRLRGAT